MRSLRIVWDASPAWAVACGVCVVVSAVVPIAFLWTMGRVVDVTLDSVGSAGGFDAMTILPSLALFGLALFGSYTAGVVSDWCREELGERLRGHVSGLIHRQMARVSYQTMQSPQFQTKAFRAISGSTQRPVNIFLSTLSLVESLLVFCSMSIWLMRVRWWLPLVVMLAGFPVFAVRVWSTREYYRLYHDQSVDERKMYYYNTVLTQPRYAPEIRLFGLSGVFDRLFDEVRQRVSGTRLAHERISTVRQVLAMALSTLAIMAVFVIVIVLSVSGGLSVGSLAMYLMTIRRAETAATTVSRYSVSLHSQALYVRSLLEFLSLDEGNTNKETFPTGFQSIDVRNVSFSYPGSDRQALCGVSFSIRRGEVVGIRGGNGSGKSTLVKLLCGLLRPSDGSVTIGGVEVSQISPSEISNHVAVVFQDFRPYCTTARENIHFGDVKNETDDIRIRQAAAEADIDGLISSLPDGYDTELGDQFPGSEMFSRGEWQRLAQARVFYSHADIIIFDEAASALDQRARVTMQNNIARLRCEGKTVIVVSHLTDTLSVVDREIALERLTSV